MNRPTLSQRLASEFMGTAFLLIAVVGSGMMGERLSQGNEAIALLANTLATGAALVVLISSFGPVSGAHFNPAVTAAFASLKEISLREAFAYIAAQVSGAFVGVGAAHLMFSAPIYSLSQHARHGPALALSESIATFGLLAVIFSVSRQSAERIPLAVGAYITGAYWFTSSTSFANPAVTLARAFSDTFAGIYWGDVPAFIIAQLLGAGLATVTFSWLVPAAEKAPPKKVP